MSERRASVFTDLSQVNKNLKDVQGYSFRLCLELDEVLAVAASITDEQAREESIEEELAGVLWRMLYERSEKVDEQVVLLLARYLRREQLSLQALPAEAVLEGRIQWGSPPLWSALSLGDEGGDLYCKSS